MTVNLIKLCVGIEDVEHLAQVQKMRLEQKRRAGLPAELIHVTRSFPRRADEVLDGGSMYWVIRGAIRVRQRITELRETVNDAGKPACGIVLDPAHILTEKRSFRAFQGWRYFSADDAPRDIDDLDGDAASLPEEMADELKELGLI
jgi:hypothetical protein